MRKRKPLLDMTEAFTPEGIAKLTKGQLIVFEKAGKRHPYRIVSTAGGKVFGRATKLYKPEEVEVVDKEVK